MPIGNLVGDNPRELLWLLCLRLGVSENWIMELELMGSCAGTFDSGAGAAAAAGGVSYDGEGYGDYERAGFGMGNVNGGKAGKGGELRRRYSGESECF